MSKGRILVTGASGFLGWNLLRRPWQGWEWVAGFNHHDPQIPGSRMLHADLTMPGAVSELLDAAKPDVVIHLAAATDLNACQNDPVPTGLINVEVPGRLAQQCAGRGIRLLFASSDMVFGGNNPPYYEATPPCPINIYGQQKAEAEARVLTACPGAAVCRMPLMFGAAGPWAHNFLPEWVGKLDRGEPVSLFTDEYRAPVSAHEACEGLRLVVERDECGIIHLGGKERMSRYAFGELLCSVWGCESGLLHAVERAALNVSAPRPADTFLDSSRAWEWGYASASLSDQLRTLRAEGHMS